MSVVRLSTTYRVSAAIRRFRSIVTILVVLAATIAAVLPARAAGAASAPSKDPRPRDFALPPRAFPSGAAVHGAPVSNEAVGSATGLHTASMTALGRLRGYEQQAQWNLSGQRGRRYHAALTYDVSIFRSPESATGAEVDAQASLWETGKPLDAAAIATPVFSVRGRGGLVSLALATTSGAVEAELVLRFSIRAPRAVTLTAIGQLTRLWTAALHRNAQLAALLPTPAPGIVSNPDVFLAPAGTGPVIESPSFMVLDPARFSDIPLQLTGGNFRPSSPPPIAGRANPAVAAIPLGSISRYIELGKLGPRDDAYDSASLFADAGSARDAFDNIVRSNAALHLSTIAVGETAGTLPHLAAAGAIHAWTAGNETVFAATWQNVVIVVAQHGPNTGMVPSIADRLLATIPTALRAQGTQIVDAANVPVHLTGLNWYGTEQQDFVVGGLDYKPYQSILWSMKRAGYNTVRLPFSDQVVEQNPIVTAHVSANPELAGLHALDIVDRIIAYAGAIGLSVILDNHRSDAGWSSQESGLWYTPAYPESAFQHDWITMARRYAANITVIGADLRNEPHGAARWGTGDPATDWKMAAERAGDAVLGANPHLLIMVEGVQYYGTAPSYWWGGNLMGVATAPVSLQFPDGSPARSQLVYSTHDYGVDNCNSGCPWFNASTSYASLAAIWDQYWGYITADPSRPYAAPVWVGEFGTCNYNVGCVADTIPGSQGQWFSSLVQYIGSKHLSWAYWSANATQSTAATRTYGTLDWYGYFLPDWVAPVPWLTSALRSIRTDGTSGPPTAHAG